MRTPSIFISYGHADAAEIDWVTRVRTFLATFETQGRVRVWDDRGIAPGTVWRDAIADALREADAAILLVGPRFLASEFIANQELPPLLDAARDSGAHIFPLIVGFCAYEQSPLEKYQSFNPTHEPLEALPVPDQHRIMNDLCLRIVQALETAPRNAVASVQSQAHRIAQGLEAERQEVVRQSTREHKTRSRVAGQRLLDMTHSFKDREVPHAELRRLLALPATHVVTVVGSAGIGKTALVSKFLGEVEQIALQPDQTALAVDGIAYLSTRTSGISLEQIFVQCARMLGGDTGLALDKVWASPNVPIGEKIRTLIEALADGHYVILLDHFQDLLDEAGRVSDGPLRSFLEACLATPGGLKLLVTSRVPIALEGQWRRFNLQVRLDEGLPATDAIAMLRELDPNGASGLRDASDIPLRRAVDRLHGMPRALEVLAGVLEGQSAYTLDDVLARFYQLDDVEDALIKVAYERLDGNAQLVLQGLTVFHRPMSVAALDFLVAPFLTPGVDVPAIVSGLARAQMANTVRGERDSTGHETVKVSLHPIDEDYASSRIPAEGPRGRRALERRAAEYYRQVRPAQEHWRSLAGLEPLLFELEHLVNAGDYADAAALLARFDLESLVMRGHAQRSLELHAMLDGHVTDPDLVLALTYAAALAHVWLGELDAASRDLNEALALARQRDNRPLAADCLGALGELARRRGALDEALTLTQQAVEAYEQVGDPVKQARWLNELSLVSVYLGEMDAGIAHAQQALALAAGRDASQEALAYDAMSLANLRLGRYQDSLESADHAIRLYQQSTWEHTTNYVLNVKGLAYLALGRIDDGIEVLTEGLGQSTADHDARPEGLAQFNLARAYRMKRDLPEALAHAAAACTMFSRMAAGELRAAQELVELLKAEAAGLRTAQARALLACARASVRAPDLCSPRDLVLEAQRMAQSDGLADVAADAESLLGLFPDATH